MVPYRLKDARRLFERGSAPEFGSVLPERRHGRIGFARARAAGRSDDFEHASADEGNSTQPYTDEEMLQAGGTGSLEGIFAAPRRRRNGDRNQKLAASGWIKPEETVDSSTPARATNTPKLGSAHSSPPMEGHCGPRADSIYDDAFEKGIHRRGCCIAKCSRRM